MLLAGNNRVYVWVGVYASCLKGKQSNICVGGCKCFLPEAISAKTTTQCPTTYSSSPMFWSLIAILASNFLNFCELIYQPTDGGRGTHIHINTLSHAHMHICTCTHAHTHALTHTHSLSHVHAHTRTHVHLYIYTHTNTSMNRQVERLSDDPQTSIQLVSLRRWRQVSWRTLGDNNSQDVIFETGYNSRLFRNSVRSSTNPSPSVISFRKSSVSPTMVDGELSAISWSSDTRPLLSTSMGCSLEPSTWKSGHNNNKRYFGHPILEELIFLAPHLGWVWWVVLFWFVENAWPWVHVLMHVTGRVDCFGCVCALQTLR